MLLCVKELALNNLLNILSMSYYTFDLGPIYFVCEAFTNNPQVLGSSTIVNANMKDEEKLHSDGRQTESAS